MWDDSVVPVHPADADPTAVELGVKFQSDVSGVVSGVRFYKGDGNIGTHTGSLWTVDGTLLATATFTNESSDRLAGSSFPSPVAITAGTRYVASYSRADRALRGRRQLLRGIRVRQCAVDALARRCVPRTASTTTPNQRFPSDSFLATNYWVDVEFRTTLDDSAPTAAADSYSVDEDAVLNQAAPGVLTNDTDTDPGTTLSAQLVSSTTHGSLTLSPDGSFSYTPQADFSGLGFLYLHRQ